MKIPLKSVLIGLVLIAGGLGVWYYIDNIEPENYEARIESPEAGSAVTSPLAITGYAHPNWYYEGTFPIEVRDANGAVIGQGMAQKQEGVSAPEGYVSFSAAISFTANPGEEGAIVLIRSNPGGKNEYNLRTEVPVTF